MNSAVSHKPSGVVLEIFIEENTLRKVVWNFEKTGLPKGVAKAFVRAFISLQGATTIESQRASWRHVQHFGSYLREKFPGAQKMAIDCLYGFAEWMVERKYSASTAGSAHNMIVRLIQWCQRNEPSCVPPRMEIHRVALTSRKNYISKPRGKELDSEFVKKILKACYSDIDAINERIKRARLPAVSKEDGELAKIISKLTEIGNGFIAKQKQCLKTTGGAGLYLRSMKFGGLSGIRSNYYLTGKDILPFYLAILAQTSGNPQSLLKAKKNCIVSVPFRDDLERVVWVKQRARKEQAPDFPKNKEWAAPNIIRKLLILNDEFREKASDKFAESLFLSTNKRGDISVPVWQEIHTELQAFCARHALQKFNLSDLRTTGAKLHHQIGRSLAAPKQRLQHADEKTTQKYTQLTDIQATHDRTILAFQGEMLSKTVKKLPRESKDKSQNEPSNESGTVFGFSCKDPFDGIAPGSRKGEACLNFGHCATCVGALVVVDDPATVAKLMHARDHLERERDRSTKEGWSRRFELLYASTLLIIERDILPSVSKSTMKKALEINVPTLPRLE